MFLIGDKVVHPMHGAGIIERITHERLDSRVSSYYVFRMPAGGLVLKIPTDACCQIGLRCLSTAEHICQVLSAIPTLEVQMSSNWNQRYRDNLARLKSGDLLEVGSSDALHPVDAIVSRATCFEKNGLEINGVVDSSDPIQLNSGVCSFTGKGSGYNTCLLYTSPSPRDRG